MCTKQTFACLLMIFFAPKLRQTQLFSENNLSAYPIFPKVQNPMHTHAVVFCALFL
jgi:hypothetical protein